ncbi:DNRLRE domain-containing protein [Demequina sp. NBRC 110054]|uniref:DNRLRE domain-containing protein n=1 Tax=Demequina sp. NBRC 110054 TaxID=1570343 RepID=UPI0009FE06D2|nr:DNRLRE domain-containing protein [Demequina sp. NBRC 110054]
MAKSAAVVTVAAFTIVVAADGAAVATEPTTAEVDWTEQGAWNGLTAPDAISAAMLAVVEDEAVEDLSQRTETSQTFALPDGQWRSDMYAGPEWVATGEDPTTEEGWEALDTSLVSWTDGSYRPGAHPADLVFSGASEGHTALVSGTDADGGDFTLWWDGELPDPVVEDDAIRYVDVEPGIDIVFYVTATGYEQFFVAQTASALERAETLSLQFDSEGAELTTDGDSITGTSDGGDEVVQVTDVLAWDADNDALRSVPVAEMAPAQEASAAASAEPSASASPELSASDVSGLNVVAEEVEVPADYDVTRDEGSVTIDTDDVPFDSSDDFPVVIDPSVNLTLSFDTYVSTAWNSDRSTQTDLLIGTWDGGDSKYRSYLNVKVSPIQGKDVTKATLKLWNYHSWSCTAKSWEVWSTSTTSASTRWSNKPSLINKYATVSSTKGYSSSCADGWVSADITTLVQNWSKGSPTTQGLGIKATSETDNAYWKRFNSGNASSNKPVLSVTYNSYPNRASSVQVNGKSPSADSVYYTNDTTPTFSATVSDPDGTKVKGLFTITTGSSTKVSKAAGSNVASGSISKYSGSTLANGKEYNVEVWTSDGSLTSKLSRVPSWSVYIDTDAPGSTSITSSQFTNGEWVDTAPSSASATLNATDAVKFEYTIDGGSTKTVTASSTSATITLPRTKGGHIIKARAIDRAGNTSVEKTFEYGIGSVAISSPQLNFKTTDEVPVVASAPPATNGTVTRAVYWRPSGTANGTGYTSAAGSASGWTELTGTSTTFATGVNPSLTKDEHYTWSAGASVPDDKERVPYGMDVQVCFTYNYTSDTICTWQGDADSHTSVVVIPHAFGDGYPTAEAGPGQVALWTGEFNTAVTDLEVPAYTGTMSISRSYSSFAGGTEDSVFGPGWSPSFEGSDLGQAGLAVLDSTGDDGLLAFQDVDGSYLLYVEPSGGNNAQEEGTYVPFDDDTASLGYTVTIAGDDTDAVLTVVDDLGVTTTWEHLGSGQWVASQITEPGSTGSTTFTHDGQGRITEILAPIPDGLVTEDNPEPCAGEAPDPGCRLLEISYYASTDAASGAYEGRVATVTFHAWDPDENAMGEQVVARYTYDAQGLLSSVTDPRSNLSVTYEYGDTTAAGVPTLTSVTPAGLATWKLTYGTASQGADSLLTVSRASETGSGSDAVISRFVYGIDVSAAPSGSPDVATAAAAWGQTRTPEIGFAVFAQGDDPGTSSPGSVTSDQWLNADIQYTDDEGYTVNTASYGAGAWQFTADEYDEDGRIVRTLDAAATAYLIGQSALNDGQPVTVEEANSVATITRYNHDIVATADIAWDGGTIAAGTVLVPAGSLVTDTWAPAEEDTDGISARIHTAYTYDEGAPNDGVNPRTGQRFNLTTTVTETRADALSGTWDTEVDVATDEAVLSTSLTGYDPIDGASATADTSGWILSSPTTTTTVMETEADNIVTLTRYDSLGRVVETRQPGSDGTDAATELTVYYTVGDNADDAQCGNAPQWAGLTCVVKTAESTPTVPEVRTTGYTMLLAPATTVETLGDVTRTSTSVYDDDGRVLTSATATEGLAGSQTVASTAYVYDDETGLLTDTKAVDAEGAAVSTVSTGYDAWGRTVTYTDADGAVTSTTYDSHGRTASVDDGLQVTAYTYDGIDAAGNDEHRGLPTALTVTSKTFDVASDAYPSYTFGAAFDEAGNMTVQTMPSDITQTTAYTLTGTTTSVSYAAVDVEGESVPLIAWTQASDLFGRVVAESTPSAGVSPEAVSQYNRTYAYDLAGRLVEVTDRTAGIGETVNTDSEAGDVTACVTRAYSFDVRGNRLSRTTGVSDTDGVCVSAGTGDADEWVYDDADRLQYAANSMDAYVYDALGRQTLIPAADTPAGVAASDLQISYYDNDLAYSITQDDATAVYGLDALQRRATATTTSSTGTESLVRHYADSSDSPAWAVATEADGTETTSWYGASLGGDLGLTITEGVATLQLADIHGDIALPITLTTDGEVAGVGGYSDFDEYGNALDGMLDPDTGAINYGWLGAKERATDMTGLMLMGVRLYNPVTGQFTSVDPVPGGNTTTYTYPQDPINAYDLDGRQSEDGLYVNYSKAEMAAYHKHAKGLPMTAQEKKAYKSYKRKVETNQKYARTRGVQPKTSTYTKSKGKSKGKSSGKNGGKGAGRANELVWGYYIYKDYTDMYRCRTTKGCSWSLMGGSQYGAGLA